MQQREPVLVVACRVDDPSRRLIPGWAPRACSKCAKPVAVSPATLARADVQAGAVFACLACADLDGVVIHAPTPEQERELRAAGYEGWPLRGAWGKQVRRAQ